MGADLISYNVVMPKGKTAAVVAEEVRRIRKGLSKFKSGADNEEIVKALELSGWDYANDFGEDSAASIDKDDFRTAVEEDLDLLKGFSEEVSYRDSSYRDVVVGGVKVVFAYAGELSWGDSPEGGGYITLRALWRLGIAATLERQVEKKRS